MRRLGRAASPVLWSATFAGLLALLLPVAAPAHAAVAASPTPPTCSTGLDLTVSQSTGPAPLLVSFTLTVYWGTPTSMSWSFGDGTYLNGSDAGALRPSHTYTVVGSFATNVEVTSTLRSGACTVGVVTTAPALVAQASASPISGTAPLTVQLYGTVQGGSGTFSQVSWSLGDGSSAPGYSLAYTYTVPGRYIVTFSAVDSLGNHATATVTIEVQAVSPPSHPSNIDVGTLSAVGAVALTLAAFAGAALYVRSHPYRFSSTGSGGDGEGWEGGGDTESEPAVELEPDPEEETHLAPTGPRFPPESYRGVFLDLSEREYDVLEDAFAERSIVAVPPEARSLRARSDRGGGPPLSRRVLIHLGALPRLGPEDVATPDFTQAGMVAALGVPQSLLSNVLRRMVYSGMISVEVAHVQSSPRRLNVYRLTPKGEQLASRLIRRTRAESSEDGPAASRD